VELVQEIVDRPGWDDNYEMAFIITGSGVRVARSFDGEEGPERAPLLHIEYLPPDCEADDSCDSDPGVTACPFIGEADYSHSSDAVFDREQVVQFAIEMDPEDWEYQLNNPDLEEYMPTALEFCGQRLEGVGMRFKKSTHPQADLPEGDPKNPIVLDLNEFNPGQDLRGLQKLNVEYGGDLELVGQRMNWEMMTDFGLDVARANSAEVSVNGENIGVFTNIERVDSAYAEHHFGEEDGQLFKHAYCGSFEYEGPDQSDYVSDTRCYSPVPGDSDTDFSELIGVIDELNNTSDEDFPDVFPLIWDVDEWIPTTAVLQVLVYGDSPNANANNFYTYYPADGGPTRFALWDLDMGYWSTLQPCQSEVDSIQWELFQYSNCYDSLPLFERMVAVPEYRERFLQAAHDFQTGPFAPETFEVHLQEIVEQLAEPLSRDPNRYGDDVQWAEDLELLLDTQSARAAEVQAQLEEYGFRF
jgi:hypothetical protein